MEAERKREREGGGGGGGEGGEGGRKKKGITLQWEKLYILSEIFTSRTYTAHVHCKC